MKTSISHSVQKLVLAIVACVGITLAGSGNGFAWDGYRDGYYYEHGYRHEVVYYHHHRGYWAVHHGVSFFISF